MSDEANFPQGPKPGDRNTTFLSDPLQDHLLRAVITLAQELSVARERNRSLEQLLVSKDILAPDELDQFEPEPADSAVRGAARNTLIASILDPIATGAASQT